MSLELLKKRINTSKDFAQNKEIENKRKVLKSAIDYSYFGTDVIVNSNEEEEFRALISLGGTEKEKTISAFFENNLKVGDIVYWIRTNTYWLIESQELSEIAYFEGKMRQCLKYQILSPDGKTKTFATIKVNPSVNTEDFDQAILKFDTTTIEISIPDNEINSSLFKIESCIQIKGFTYKINNIDNISIDGIIKIYAKRDFDNNPNLFIEEDKVENDNDYIIGPKEIVPLEEVTYTISNDIEGTWTISDNSNITKTINNDNSLTIVWKNTRKRNNFTISYGDYSKEIIVKSLF